MLKLVSTFSLSPSPSPFPSCTNTLLIITGVNVDQIVADCWSIGYEERFGPGLRLQQAFVYARLGPDEHLYAHPLDFNCVVDSNAGKVLYIGKFHLSYLAWEI